MMPTELLLTSSPDLYNSAESYTLASTRGMYKKNQQ